MALGKDIILSRLIPEKIVLENAGFTKFVARRTGVSAAALSTAHRLLTQGLVEALAEGYAVRWWGVGTFECREMPPRKRYHRLKKHVYMSPPTTLVHFKKTETLNQKVRDMAKARLEKALTNPLAKLAVRQ
jgi:nucleoid DNA-binding protein